MDCHYAHYDRKTGKKQRLHKHLMEPAERITEAIPPSVQFSRMSNEEVKEIIRWVYLLHDFGKYTDFFQDYLLKNITSSDKGHSFISACLAYSFLLKRYDIDNQQEASKVFLGFICILRHHSSLQVIGILDKEAQSVQERLKRQSEQIQKKVPHIFKEAPWERYFDEQSLHELLQVQKIFENECLFWEMSTRLTVKRQHINYWYFPLVYLFSLLIDIDKINSVGFERSCIQATEPKKIVSYLQKKHKGRESDLINRRENARRTIIETVDKLSDIQVKEQRFFTLTAPTGIGKTLASLQAALTLQNRITEIEGYTPRVITAIPFINIIEQTRSDYQAIFPDGLIVHHRLTDFTEQKIASTAEQENTSVDKQLMLVESWEGQTILTTFVQLFHSLLTGSNRPLKKINKLAGSIVILDEVQSIAHEKMPLIGALLQKVAEFYGTRFILMTATQPMLLEQGTKLLRLFVPQDNRSYKPIELLADYQKYFKSLNRTQFIPQIEMRMDTAILGEFVLGETRKWQENIKEYFDDKVQDKHPSVLVVVNTIQRSIDVFKKFKEMRKEGRFGCKIVLAYLSTNLVPKHRRRVINFVRKCLVKGKPIILVSTQTIEAGVDLDFDMGFRDLAPLTSLIQTAGRINREGLNWRGLLCPLYIVRLEKDCSWVYSTNEMSATRDLLRDKKSIPESQYQALVETYYRNIANTGIASEIKDIWEKGVLGLNFDEIKKFSLIDSIGEVADVFIEYDTAAILIAEAYRELLKQSEKVDWVVIQLVLPSVKVELDISEFTRRSLLRLISAKMSDYIVQIRVKKIQQNCPFEFRDGSNLFWVPKSEIGLYYSVRTGYKAEPRAFLY